MNVDVTGTVNSSAKQPANAKVQQRNPYAEHVTPGNVETSNLTRCGAMRLAVRAMLKLASEAAFDIWSGYTHSLYLEKFEATHRDQLDALKALKQLDSQADLRFLIRKAETALVALADAVQSEIVSTVEPAMSEVDFKAVLGRVKDRAITASESIGSIQRAATNG